MPKRRFTPKLANKAGQSAAEPVERRAETKGNAGQLSTCRTQSRAGVSQELEWAQHSNPEFGPGHSSMSTTVLMAPQRTCGGLCRSPGALTPLHGVLAPS
jgi:hypothetical protein